MHRFDSLRADISSFPHRVPVIGVHVGRKDRSTGNPTVRSTLPPFPGAGLTFSNAHFTIHSFLRVCHSNKVQYVRLHSVWSDHVMWGCVAMHG